MISVVIATHPTERLLIPALAALVPGAAAGLVREVMLVDAGDGEIADIADAAGCEYLQGPPDPGARLRQGAAAARSAWLLFLDPQALLQEGWPREVRGFIDQVERNEANDRQAATFRLALDGFGIAPRLREAAAMARHAVTGRPRAQQGLLIHRRFYDRLGGHPPGPAAPHRLVRRIRRGGLVLLRSQILLPG